MKTLTAKLISFKVSGKFDNEWDVLVVWDENLYVIWNELRLMYRERLDAGQSIMVRIPEHPFDHPFLLKK